MPVPGGPHRMSDGSSLRLERPPQQLPRPEQVRLPDELGERARPHPLGERLPAPILDRRPREQVHRGESSRLERPAGG